MKIKQLILSGYKRLILNNINYIDIKPEQVFQLILGTNGSGKSSVLYELSPLPAHSKNYIKNGFKEIHISHRGNEYVLISDFKSVNKHSFVKNKEELNPGGTGAVQKELVEQHFSINQNVHEMLIGEIKFTDLSPSKRREWLTNISDVDFTYALGVYKRLKTSARDAQGALKHIKGRLVSENHKLLSIGNLETIEETYRELQNILKVLMNNQNSTEHSPTEINKSIKKTLEEISFVSENIIKTKPQIPTGYNIASLEELDELLNKSKMDIRLVNELRENTSNEYVEIKGIVEDFKKTGYESLSGLKNELNNLENEIKTSSDKLIKWNDYKGDPILSKNVLYEIQPILSEIFNSLKPNPNKEYSSSKLKQVSDELDELNKKIHKFNNSKAKIEKEINHLESLKEQTCPKCNHKWIPGRSDKEMQSLVGNLKNIEDSLTKHNKSKESAESYLEEGSEYNNLLSRLKHLEVNNTSLRDFWDFIKGSGKLFKSPSDFCSDINILSTDLEVLSTLQNKKERLDELKKILSSSKDEDQLKLLENKVNALESKIEEYTVNLTNENKQQENLSSLKKNIKTFISLSESLDLYLESITKLEDDFIDSTREESISLLIEHYQLEMAKVQADKNEKNTLENLISDLEKDKERVKKEEEILSLLAKELSPSDGLIAEQLKGFISSFVKHVNEVIGSIWTYDLIVKPCGTENGDLDYKFPLHISHNGSNNTSPDISKSSEAQVEVINLAFKLVMMVYLGLEEYPVYLDEFSRSFDEQHRDNAMDFVRRLIDSGNYTQLFLISHYAVQFNSFPNADILVLDDTNVSIPKDHNTHVVIK